MIDSGVGLHSPQRPYTASFEDQRGLCQWLANPAHCECTENMSVRYDQDVAAGGICLLETWAVVFLFDLSDQRVETADNVIGRSGRKHTRKILAHMHNLFPRNS